MARGTPHIPRAKILRTYPLQTLFYGWPERSGCRAVTSYVSVLLDLPGRLAHPPVLLCP